MPQDPDIIATKAISGDVLLFDLKDYPVITDARGVKVTLSMYQVCAKGIKKMDMR